MPRSPLFHALKRAHARALAAATGGPSAAELAARLDASWKTRGPTRRELLASGAALALGLAAGGCRRPRGDAPSGARVVIAGAGIAGLTAGHRLRQAGVPVTILEAQARTGGRMLSLRDFFADGQVAELGGELIDTGHTAIRALAAELEIPLDDLATDDPSLERETWFFDGRLLSAGEIVDEYRPIAERIVADLATLPAGPTASYREPNGAETLDRTSLAEWLDGAGATGWMRRLLDVAYTTEYGLEIDRQSALNLLFLIDPEPEPFAVFGESDERFHVRGGNDRIPAALAGRLADSIRLGTRLEAVRQRSDGAFECSVRSGGRSETLAASHLVLALPFTLLRQVRLDLDLPPAKRRAIDGLAYGTNAKLMAGFSQRVWRTRHGANGSLMTDLPFQSTWETSRLQEGTSGILTNFTGGEHGAGLGTGTAEGQAARLVGDLERVFPGATAAHREMKAARFHWPSHPFTRGSYACYGPGQWTSIAGAEGEPVGRLYFAGEHCSLVAQGFMEGGCETGERAAREVLADLGLAAGGAAAA